MARTNKGPVFTLWTFRFLGSGIPCPADHNVCHRATVFLNNKLEGRYAP